jgi:hypothetical protein
MSTLSSRRRTLSVIGAAVMGAFGGCFDATESNEVDITVSNASDTPISYEVTVEEFEETGRIDAGGSDQYEDEIDRPGSAGQFDVVASFESVLDDTGDEPAESNSETGGNESTSEDSQTRQFGTTVSVDSDVIELSVTYTGEQMVVNPVVENDSS